MAPTRPPRPCPRPGCTALIGKGVRYCADHTKEVQAQVDKRRGSPSARGYGRQWRKVRAMVLRRQPLCATGCGQASTEVDHKVPKSKGGCDRTENLQGLCKPCHSTKTAKMDGRWGVRGRRGARA